MSFSLFDHAIKSSDLRAVAAHWNAARGCKRMPAWHDISPGKIAKQLPIIWSYSYDSIQDEFIGRLGGEAISRIFGRNIKGAKLSELDPIIGKEQLIKRAKKVMATPALFRSYEPMFWQRDSRGVGERILMPLASDGITADGILGATEYHVEGYIASDAEKIVTAENWFVIPENLQQIPSVPES